MYRVFSSPATPLMESGYTGRSRKSNYCGALLYQRGDINRALVRLLSPRSMLPIIASLTPGGDGHVRPFQWSTIKHKKAVKDARRGKMFTKLIKDLSIAARIGGSDPSANPRLRTAIAAAKAASMPGDTIDRAVKKGAGELEGVSYEEVTYEGHAPGGAAIMLQTLTDNKNRTVSEVRHLFTKSGGSLGQPNSVAWMFTHKGIITIEKDQAEEDQLMEIALDAGAEDVTTGDDMLRL